MGVHLRSQPVNFFFHLPNILSILLVQSFECREKKRVECNSWVILNTIAKVTLNYFPLNLKVQVN